MPREKMLQSTTVWNDMGRIAFRISVLDSEYRHWLDWMSTWRNGKKQHLKETNQAFLC